MPGAPWLFSEAEYVTEVRSAGESSRARGKQFGMAVPRTGQTGSNWSSVDDRQRAEAPLNALGDGAARSALRGAAARRAGAHEPPRWVPTNPSRRPSGPGSFEGTFRGRPYKYIAPEVETRGPPPRLLHNPPQMLSRAPSTGGPGTAGREMSAYPYMSDAPPPTEPRAPHRAAEPRGFVAGRPRAAAAADANVYSMDAFRPPAAAQRRATVVAGARDAAPPPPPSVAAGGFARLGPEWKPSPSGRTVLAAGVGAYPAYRSDVPAGAAGPSEAAQRQAPVNGRRAGAKSFGPAGVAGTGPFGRARAYVSTTAAP
ncbi:hypothetical protein KFE25_000649 [Diacronema lutheri]|uniref:Uncharacterized protein n=1 Tax=Diacronema lutheri TaxID=2081491 RepID=A0A8J6CH36_DIALT|nr:hypothetical protein KFE25_000649 [Diacronema lutheri]